MTIGRAMKFIDRGQVDSELRGLLNRASTPTELYDVLSAQDLSFSAFDFEEAFNNRLVSCQFQEQADQLQEFKTWWELLHRMIGSPEVPASDGSCESASQCAVAGACKGCH